MNSVLLWSDSEAEALLARYGLKITVVAKQQPIPGSYWGDNEAGLIGNRLYVNAATPLHSLLHEACHYICMSPERRRQLDTNAGGGYLEENGVCYLQILLSDCLPGCGRARMFEDMDAWGYSFRLGSTQAWFENDAEDARTWLQEVGVIDAHEKLRWCLRETGDSLPHLHAAASA